MSVRDVNGRVVLLALLVTLGIYLAAGGTSVDEVAHAGSLNQTIPTMTPTGATSTATASNPTVPPPTQAPTEPPGVPSDTPSATSQVPSSTPTDAPTSGVATATDLATSTLTPTSLPAAGSPTSTSISTSTLTPAPAVTQSSTAVLPSASPIINTPSPAPNLTAIPGLTVENTSTPQPSATQPSVQIQRPVEPERTSGGSMLSGSSCLWIVLGLLLVLAGVVLLVRWRRSG